MDVEGLSDRDLLSRVAERDQAAFGALYDRLAGAAYSLAYHMLRDARWAEDVVQEAFVNIWRHAGAYDVQRGTVKAWALTAVRNRAVDHIRRQQVRPQTAGPVDPDILASAPDAVWDETSKAMEAAAVREALGVLSEDQRNVIELAYYGGMSQQEIADETGLPLGTVKGRMRLALAKLRDALAASRSEELQ